MSMDEKEVLLGLISCLEQERSYERCIELASALGYEISGEPGEVWVDKPDSPLLSLWFSMDALIEELIGDARRLVVHDG
jgi:hypothetical protein